MKQVLVSLYSTEKHRRENILRLAVHKVIGLDTVVGIPYLDNTPDSSAYEYPKYLNPIVIVKTKLFIFSLSNYLSSSRMILTLKFVM